MYQFLRMLHVVGWAGWFGLVIAEPLIGTQIRQVDPKQRVALAKVWLRVGKVELAFMAVAVIFGMATFLVLAQMGTLGMAAFMKQKANLYLHVMMGMGLLAGLFALIAGQARTTAVAALDQGNDQGFTKAYGRAAMFGGISSLLIVLTILEVLLRNVAF